MVVVLEAVHIAAIPVARTHKASLEGVLEEVPEEVQLDEVLEEVFGGVLVEGLKEVPNEVNL